MLINCVVYQGGLKLKDITVEEISDYVCSPDCFVWVALKDATKEEIMIMKEEFNLHELAVEDAHKGRQRPKIEEYGDTVFAVLHLIEMKNDYPETGQVNIFAGKNFILSVRNESGINFLGVRSRCEQEPHHLVKGSGFVLYALMDAIVDSYFPLIEEFESELESIEENIFKIIAGRSNVERLYDLKQKTIVLRHAVVPLAEALSRLTSNRAPSICEASREYFRDVYDHLNRIIASLDNIRETIATAMQVNLSLVTIEDSQITKKLAAYAGIFAVATAFAGVWGMNFKFMPELDLKYGYPVALAVIVGACYFVYRRFKRSGWL